MQLTFSLSNSRMAVNYTENTTLSLFYPTLFMDSPLSLRHKIEMLRSGRVAQLAGASAPAPKGCGFDLWSGHTPRLRVRSPVGLCKGGYQSMFLSLTHSLPHPLLLL